MTGDRRRATGALGERLAADHLARRGYRLLARNYRTRFGELDIVAVDGDCLVFCEVRARVAGTAGGPDGPLDSIGPTKRRRLRLMAREWLSERAADPGARRTADALRFDAIGVTLERDGALVSLDHVSDAF